VIASEVFFLPAPGGQRLCILDRPVEGCKVKGTMLFVHPWAEELNKSRRAVAIGSRALARDGWAVLRIDLFGCGDSSGDFGNATWEMWIDDVTLAAQWLTNRFGTAPRLWGLRAGCLLIVDYIAKWGGERGLLLWQPVLSGRQHLTQFLRLRAANEMLGNGAERTGTQNLREQVAKGASVEVAGYRLTEGLAGGLERAEFHLPPKVHHIHWLEISNSAEPKLSPASEARIVKLVEGGCQVDSDVVPGQAFWQTVEIAESPALVARTVEMAAA
jgi:uncharacterized protein